MTDADWPADPGLAGERTAMAWVRTALSLFGAGALVARQSSSTAVAALVLTVAVVAAGWLVVDAERRHAARAAGAGSNAAPAAVLGLTAITVSLALVGLTPVLT